MQEKNSILFIENTNALAFIKVELNTLVQKELLNLQSLGVITDQFMVRQRSKNNFQPQQYCRELNLILAELEMHFSNLVLHISTCPILNYIANILQKISNYYHKINEFSQDHWLYKVKQLKKCLTAPETSPPPAMDMCLHCSEHIRHQEIKQARFRLYNPIEDPYSLFQNGETYRPDHSQQTRQKYLQDKLSQLASNVELGQNCMRELLEKFSVNESQFLNSDQNNSRQIEHSPLPVIPLIKSVFTHMKTEKKSGKSISTQTDIYSRSREQIQAAQQDKEVCVKANIKMAAELCDKSNQIRLMETKINQSEKTLTELKNQVIVLQDANQNLQKRNSALEVQLNISIAHSKLTKSVKRLQNPRNLYKKFQESAPLALKIEQKMQKNQKDEIVVQKKRKSIRADGKLKKPQIFTSNKSNISHNQNSSKIFKKVQIAHLRQQGSTFSIEQRDQDFDLQNQHDIEVILTPPTLEQQQARPETDEDGETPLFSKFTRTPSIMKNQISLSQTKKLRQMARSQNPSPQFQRKIRRLGVIYNRQEIIKILYEEEVRNKGKSMNYDLFRNTMIDFIEKAISGGGNSQGGQKEFSKTAQGKARFRNVPKKSAISIRQTIRNEVTAKGDAQNTVIYDSPGASRSILSPQYEDHISQQSNPILFHLKQSILLNISNSDKKIDKKIVLEKHEHKMMTEIMACLIQLKVSKKKDYDGIRRIISTLEQKQNSSLQISEKEELQISLSQLINKHRACPRLPQSIYCDHLQTFLNSTVSLIG